MVNEDNVGHRTVVVYQSILTEQCEITEMELINFRKLPKLIRKESINRERYFQRTH